MYSGGTGGSDGTAARAVRAARAHVLPRWVPQDPWAGNPRELSLKDPSGFPWDPISGAQGSLVGGKKKRKRTSVDFLAGVLNIAVATVIDCCGHPFCLK